MADKTNVTIEDIRTQCVVVTKAVIELRKSQQKYYRCFRDNPRKGEFLAESKMNEHMVDAELVKYQYLCECLKNQQLPTEGEGTYQDTQVPEHEPVQEAQPTALPLVDPPLAEVQNRNNDQQLEDGQLPF